MYRNCARCGIGFEADEYWKKLCLPCWKETKREEVEGNNRIIERLAKDNIDQYREIERLRAILAASEQRAQNAHPEAIPPDMLRVLLLLAHPDRHNGSQAANKATTWLLQQRGKA